MTALTWFLAVASLVGVGVTVHNAYDAVLDLRALDTVDAGLDSRRIIARSNLRTQVARAVQLTLFALVAALPVFGLDLHTRRMITIAGLTAVALLLIGASINDRFTKQRLLRRIHLEERRAQHPLSGAHGAHDHDDRDRVHEDDPRVDPPDWTGSRERN